MDLIWRNMGTSVGLARPRYALSVCPLRCLVQYVVFISRQELLIGFEPLSRSLLQSDPIVGVVRTDHTSLAQWCTVVHTVCRSELRKMKSATKSLCTTLHLRATE